MTTLENNFLKVLIQNKGAQLTSVFDKINAIEYLWQADPVIWAWHAPNLFPVVGECINNQIIVKGKSYPMGRHGFARQSEFKLLDSNSTSALFSLSANENTLEIYPYRFQFQIAYRLEDKGLKVTFRVMNEDNETIYFSVGGHPAFNVPFSPDENYADYYIEFEKDEKLERHLISGKGLFTGETEPVNVDGRKMHLRKDLFNADALVFKNISSGRVSLRSKNHNNFLTLEFPDFPYLGIWAKPGAPFVCIEPWLGCADTEEKQVPIQEKEAIQHVNLGEVYEVDYWLRIS